MHQSPSGQWLLPSKQVIAGPNPAWCYANVVHQQYTNLPGWIKWGQHPSFAPFFVIISKRRLVWFLNEPSYPTNLGLRLARAVGSSCQLRPTMTMWWSPEEGKTAS